MEVQRLKRYNDKLELMGKRTNQIEEWSGEFQTNEKTTLACYKAFQEVTEASTDIAAMIITDLQAVLKDDYSNIELLLQKKL